MHHRQCVATGYWPILRILNFNMYALNDHSPFMILKCLLPNGGVDYGTWKEVAYHVMITLYPRLSGDRTGEVVFLISVGAASPCLITRLPVVSKLLGGLLLLDWYCIFYSIDQVFFLCRYQFLQSRGWFWDCRLDAPFWQPIFHLLFLANKSITLMLAKSQAALRISFSNEGKWKGRLKM